MFYTELAVAVVCLLLVPAYAGFLLGCLTVASGRGGQLRQAVTCAAVVLAGSVFAHMADDGTALAVYCLAVCCGSWAMVWAANRDGAWHPVAPLATAEALLAAHDMHYAMATDKIAAREHGDNIHFKQLADGTWTSEIEVSLQVPQQEEYPVLIQGEVLVADCRPPVRVVSDAEALEAARLLGRPDPIFRARRERLVFLKDLFAEAPGLRRRAA